MKREIEIPEECMDCQFADLQGYNCRLYNTDDDTVPVFGKLECCKAIKVIIEETE